jgi:menaquinone-dependent protoporphyrinogen oxidase
VGVKTAARNILVAYGSERGGTAEIAIAIGEALRDRGHVVACIPARAVRAVDDFDVVIVGGALYMNRWHRDARRLVTTHAAALRARPTWLFSSGPLDDSASKRDIAPVGVVARLSAQIGARGHATFGGRLERDAKGFIAHAMAKKLAGDWRDWNAIAAWAGAIADALAAEPIVAPASPPSVAAPAPAAAGRRVLGALALLVGFAAVAGGLALIVRPDGSLLRFPADTLDASPFSTFLVPGLVLCAVIGLANVVAGVLVLRDAGGAGPAAFAGGALLFGWIVAQMMFLGTANALQLVFLAIAVAMMGLSLRGIPGESAKPV